MAAVLLAIPLTAAAPAGQPAPSTADRLARLEAQVASMDEPGPTPQEIELSRADLKAQQGMDQSTRRIMKLTWAQVGLGLATLFGLFATLLATRDSLRQTRQALSQTERIARLQLRAYVGMSGSTADTAWKVGKDFAIRIKFENHGDTPAKNIHCKTLYWVIDSVPRQSPFDDFDFQAEPGFATKALPPGSSFGANLVVPLDTDRMQGFIGQTKSLLLAIQVDYTDEFDYRWRLYFSQIRTGPFLKIERFNPATPALKLLAAPAAAQGPDAQG